MSKQHTMQQLTISQISNYLSGGLLPQSTLGCGKGKKTDLKEQR
jgi:hypothetical protein